MSDASGTEVRVPLSREISRRSLLRGAAAVGASLSVGGLLAACSSSGGSTKTKGVTLSVGTQTIADTTLKPIFASYQASSGNKLDIQVIEDDHFDNLLTTKIATGGLWDVWDRYTGTAAMHQYRPDVNCVDLSSQPWVDRVSPAIKPLLAYTDGKVYSVPFGPSSVLAPLYNKKVFSDAGVEVPTTIDAMMNAYSKIKSSGVTPVYLGAKDSWPVTEIFDSAWPNICAANPGLVEKLNKNEVRWPDVPQFIDYLNMLKSFADQKFFNADMSAGTYDAGLASIAAGKSAVMYVGDFVYPTLKQRYPSAPIGMFPQPAFSGQPWLNLAGPPGFYVSKSAKDVPATENFVAYLASVHAQSEYLKNAPGFAPFKDVPANLTNPLQLDVKDLVTSGRTQPHVADVYIIPYGSDEDTIFLQLITGDKSVAQTASAFDGYVQSTGKQLKLPGF